FMEAGRALTLRRQMSLDQQVAGLEDETQATISKLRIELAQQEVAAAKSAYAREQILAAYQTRQELEAVLKQTDITASLFPPVSLKTLRTRLNDQTAVLSYYVTDEQYYILAINKDRVKFVEQTTDFVPPGWHATKAKKNALKIATNPGVGVGPSVMSKLDVKLKLPSLEDAVTGCLRATKKSDLKRFPFYAANLYGKLIHPVRETIEDRPHLVVLPDGPLYQLPFELLVEKDPGKENMRFNKLPYLIKKHAISYHYSAAVYLSDRIGLGGPTFLGLAPVFDDFGQGNELAVEHVALRDSSRVAEEFFTLDEDRQRFRPLAASDDEIVAIGALLSRGEPSMAKVLLREAATEQAFKEHAPRYHYVHLASHSFSHPTDPALSGIAFRQPGLAPRGEDGILYARELMDMTLKARLLVLSSCESARGPYQLGEGALSLTYAGLTAGASNVVSGLWKVNDRHTATLMKRFYQYHLGGENLGTSLRQAKLKLIRNSRTAAPALWAPFVLYGRENF
ncbi:MAG: CHAT domain-containing protein, partial [Bacteroidota bacterium]